MLSAIAKKICRFASAALVERPEGARPQTATLSSVHRHFLIVSNGRTGSSWLLTSLDRLPCVAARQELKWVPDHIQPLNAMANVALKRGLSVTMVIEAILSGQQLTASIGGSKLVFNPYTFYGPVVFSRLIETVETGVRVVLLKRRYFETWLSWKARGVYHDIDTQVPVMGNNTMLEAMLALPEPQVIDLIIHHGGRALAEGSGRAYPLEDAVDDLLQFYANDVQALTLCAVRHSLLLDYEDIGARLREISRFIGAEADSDVIAVIREKAQTRKLPSLTERVKPHEPLRSISQALDAAFWRAAGQPEARASALQWANKETIIITDPGVVSAFTHAGLAVRDGMIRWRIRKPRLNA